ncbi:hypothetical protein [Marisediminicola senii]|uniref:hypothetical protein n=1 Tax=Marisediminicola senii TaxID=2711233 RepID=UPI0013EB83D1|nr:hypothetical protein [Marisediminicola senii]
MDLDTREAARNALRAEREVWRARLRAAPLDQAARRALAESYRSRCSLDQAGRWGLLVADGSTVEERRLFARYLVRTNRDDPDGILRSLEIPKTMSPSDYDPHGAIVELAEYLQEERRLFDEGNEQLGDVSDDSFSIEDLVELSCIAAAVGVIGTGFAVLLALLLGGERDLLLPIALGGLGLTTLFILSLCVYLPTSYVMSRRRARAPIRWR